MKKRNSRASRKVQKQRLADGGSTSLKLTRKAFGGLKEITLDGITVRAVKQA